MSDPIELVSLYLHLAKAAWRRLHMPDRDRMLVISAVNSERIGLRRIAAYCRTLILENNPGHMLRRWPTVADAIVDSDFQHFLKQLQRRFPQERAEVMLADLNIDRSNERHAYYNDEEYAASVLGVNLQWLQENFPD